MSALGLKPGRPHALSFAPGGARNDLRLLEVDENLLKEIIDEGVVVKGGEEDEAVLVTSCRTYAMKLVETTNLQLLVGPQSKSQPDAEPGVEAREQSATVAAAAVGALPSNGSGLMTQWSHFRASSLGQGPITVDATSAAHIQLVEVAPRLETLRGLLWRHPYGIEDERVGAGGDTEMAEATVPGAAGYTFEQLLHRVQASPGELRTALQTEGALDVGGRWRAVDANYLGTLLEMVLLTAEQEGMPLQSLDASTLTAVLQPDGYHPALIQHCLKVYGRSSEEAVKEGMEAKDTVGSPDPPMTWCLDEEKVCVHFAVKVLAGRSLPLTEFNAAWERAVPYGMTPSLEMLRSEALIDGSGAEARISSFPASALPRDPVERFAALFRRRPRWEWTSLEPYLAGMKVPGHSVEALLMRFARGSQPTPESPLVYSAR